MTRQRRFLVLTLEAAGNWPPELALIRALTQRGHLVRVVSNANHATQIDAAGAIYEPYRHAPQRDSLDRSADPNEPEMVRILREVFFNPTFADELLAAIAREKPDVLLVDQMLIMAGIAAESTGLPTAILWHTVYGATASMWAAAAGFLGPMNALRARLGLAPIEKWTVARAADAILAFTYQEFDTDPLDPPPQLHYVGPLACLPHASGGYPLPWPSGDRRPLILVSYSTSFQDQIETLQRVADAVAGIDARVLMTLGHAISPSELRLPDNVIAEQFIPHAAVLPHARLVVTHAGHGTVMAAVTAGVPVVCTPMGRDQHAVSACVAARGLGRVVPMTASVDELSQVIGDALTDPGLRERARTFAAGVDLEAGVRRALAVLEQL